MAMIRRDKLSETKKALEAIGLGAMTIQTVNGRGLQGGNMMTDIDPVIPESFDSVSKITSSLTPAHYALAHSLTRPVFWIPKRMIQVLVPDTKSDLAIKAIMEANRTGKMGDGKIFVIPVEETVRVRTGQRGPSSL